MRSPGPHTHYSTPHAAEAAGLGIRGWRRAVERLGITGQRFPRCLMWSAEDIERVKADERAKKAKRKVQDGA